MATNAPGIFFVGIDAKEEKMVEKTQPTNSGITNQYTNELSPSDADMAVRGHSLGAVALGGLGFVVLDKLGADTENAALAAATAAVLYVSAVVVNHLNRED